MSTLAFPEQYLQLTGNFVRLRAYISCASSLASGLLLFACAGVGQAPPPRTPRPEVEFVVVAPLDRAQPSAPGETLLKALAGREPVELPEEEGDDEQGAPEPVPAQPHPLEHWSTTDLQRAVREQPESLGAMSVGAPNGGALFNAVQLPEDPRWERVDASHAWGTAETIDNIQKAIAKVASQFPDTPPLPIGHISAKSGGHLNPHRSHQAGTDVDLGFYYRPDAHRWYVRGTKDTLDLARTWALVRAFVTETDVRFILVDRSIQTLLEAYAASIGENQGWLDDLFRGRGHSRPPLLRHAPGHATHLHVRFYSPIAEETGRRCYPALVSSGKVKPATHFVSYRAKKGDTLLGLAKRFGTTVKAIKRVNGLRSNTILAKRSYNIPSTGHSVRPVRTAEVPPRRLPPLGARFARDSAPNEDEKGWDTCGDESGGDCE